MWWIGVDPGKSGAIAIVDDYGNVKTVRMTETPRDVFWFIDAYKFQAKLAVLEYVAAMPKQGVSSTFKFGASFGFCQGLLVAIEVPFELVTPKKWQAAMKCRSGGDKNITKQKAQELFPKAETITHATADAILLAEYSRRLWHERHQ